MAQETKEKLKQIWDEVLKCGEAKLNENSNFFELGGDSVQAITLCSRANDAGIRLTHQHVFDSPGLADMAEAASGSGADEEKTGDTTKPSDVTENLMEKWDLIQECFLQTGIPNHELEDIVRCPPFQQELMCASNDLGIFTLQLVFDVNNERSLERARRTIEEVQQRNAILRTRIVQHEQESYQVITKTPLEWDEVNGSLEAYTKQNLAKRVTYGQALVRYAVVRDSGRLFIVWMKPHAVYDRWSRYALMDDLEKGFKDLEAMIKSKPRAPFRVFNDYLARQDREAGIKFWKDRIEGVERFDLLGEEDRSRDSFLSCKADMKIKYMPFRRPQTRIGLDAINQVASALMLANESEHDDIFLVQMRSCRQLAIDNIDQVFGPFWSPCPVRRKLDGSQTLQEVLD